MFEKISNKLSNKSKTPSKIDSKDLEVSNNNKNKSIKKNHPDIYADHIKRKKEVLPKNTLTREEVYEEIEKQFKLKQFKDTNPFKTREDMYFIFYNSTMQLNKQPVPFEEIRIGGKPFYIHKKFENNQIVIEQMFSAPDIEINLRDEYSKKETTKKQLGKINTEILYIKNKIAEGEEKYKLLDIEDLEEEKLRLERILDSIKYGKNAIFIFQDPITNKKAFMLRYSNGEYKYLKITENNFITEENNIKFLKGYETQKKLEEVTNFRIMKNWKEIFMALTIFIIVLVAVICLVKLAMFEEELFDERVKNYCGDQAKFYEDKIAFFKDMANSCNVDVNSPSYKQQI